MAVTAFSHMLSRLAGKGVRAMAGRAAGTGALSSGARGATSALNWYRTLGTTGRLAVTGGAGGAIAGGMYGAFSEDTSVLGGALKGAMLGAGLGAGVGAGSRAYRIGAPVYKGLRAGGAGRGQAAAVAFRRIGLDARANIGKTWSRAVNGIKSSMKANGGAPAGGGAMSGAAVADVPLGAPVKTSRIRSARAFKEQQAAAIRKEQQALYGDAPRNVSVEERRFMAQNDRGKGLQFEPVGYTPRKQRSILSRLRGG